MIIELFSTRRRLAEASGKEDVFVYDEFPSTLRVQLQQLFSEALGPVAEEVGHYAPKNDSAWDFIRKSLCREKGLHRLSGAISSKADVLNYLGSAQDVMDVLDVSELCCRYIELVLKEKSDYGLKELGVSVSADDALAEFNYRLKRSGVGYAYEDGQILRIDSQLIHEEVVKPALRFLNRKGFEGPREEFLQAFMHAKSGANKDAIIWANKAFESTMKVVCDIKGWDFDKGSRASDLLKILRRNGFFPNYLDNSFDQLTAILGSGLPQVRNNEAGHGDGGTPRETPPYVASLALHLAAAKIVFLVEASQ